MIEALDVELTQWTQHPVAVDVRPALTEVVDGRQLETRFLASDTVGLVRMPVGVRDALVRPNERLPDPRRCTRRRVCALTACPVALISGQTEHAWTLADTSQSLCIQTTTQNYALTQATRGYSGMKRTSAKCTSNYVLRTTFQAC